MLKNILNLEGVQKLNKKEQQSFNGGLQKLCSFCGFYIPNMIVCADGTQIPCIED